MEGKFGDFDLTYAGAYMKRNTHSIADYSDYSEFYDRVVRLGRVLDRQRRQAHHARRKSW